ncbi:MAG TPA: hypothetical protein VM802_19930 [Chitinophaga sp.]|uniref:hypothetical protein n=1 Tax=Chitinophaga sp. TaxID=1869181 RepID=UPI002C422C6B|nr:hypothetical protein [Chitinophaga sp.]HVI47157.1 hypothetical protein [Chitinophaga sp.]
MIILLAFTVKENPQTLWILPVLLLLSWSMYAYSKLQLLISKDAIIFRGGLNPHHIQWQDITKIDMYGAGKYDTPIINIYYKNRKLEIARSTYLHNQFNKIIGLLEMKVSDDLFTARYIMTRKKLS